MLKQCPPTQIGMHKQATKMIIEWTCEYIIQIDMFNKTIKWIKPITNKINMGNDMIFTIIKETPSEIANSILHLF